MIALDDIDDEQFVGRLYSFLEPSGEDSTGPQIYTATVRHMIKYLFPNQEWRDLVSGYFFSPSAEVDGVRLTYFLRKPTASDVALQEVLERVGLTVDRFQRNRREVPFAHESPKQLKLCESSRDGYDGPETDFRRFLAAQAQVTAHLIVDCAAYREVLEGIGEYAQRRIDIQAYEHVTSLVPPQSFRTIVETSLSSGAWWTDQSEDVVHAFFERVESKLNWFHMLDNSVFYARHYDGSSPI